MKEQNPIKKKKQSGFIIVALIGLIVIILIVVLVVTIGGGGGGQNPTTTCQIPSVTSYNMGFGPERIHIQVKRIRIDVRKDDGTARDDVFFTAAMYHDSLPNEPQLLNSNAVFKVHKNDINNWVDWAKDLTDFTSAQLTPRSTIAFILYDKDPGKQRQDWQYTADRCLRYPSRENAYGTIHMSWADFNGMTTDDTRIFNLAEGAIEVSIIRRF